MGYPVDYPPKVGDLVYRAFNPKKIGLVRGIGAARKSGVSHVLVEWQNGETERIDSYWVLNSLEDLIASTTQTLLNHQARRDAALRHFHPS